MPNFRYRALTAGGEVVSGLISAATAAEVARRIDYLNLVPIDDVIDESTAQASRLNLKLGPRVRSDDITIFTFDLALLLKAGARLDRALELLAGDADIGRLRSTVGAIHSSVLAGESFADAARGGRHRDCADSGVGLGVRGLLEAGVSGRGGRDENLPEGRLHPQ